MSHATASQAPVTQAPLALPDYNQLREQLLQDIDICAKLMAILENEHSALTSHDKDTINESLTAKQELMFELERHAKQRQTWLNQAYPKLIQAPNHNKSELWLALLRIPGLPELEEHWATLENNLKECKTRNETNGKVIARSQQTVKKLINIMRGQSVDGPKLYTARGETRAQSYSHSFTKA